MDKATRAQVKRHNRRLVMRALYEDLANNRAALAITTGLTKPTIGTIVSELIETGYVTEDGFGISSSSGGKRPTIIRFLPDARQVIGLSITETEIIAGLSYLDGTVIARHHTDITQDNDLMTEIQFTINALMAQSDAAVLCIAIGVSGMVNSRTGLVIQSSTLNWSNVPLGQAISKVYNLPCYVSNNTELIARMQVKQSSENPRHLVTVSIGNSIEIGSTFGEDVYQHGGNIANIPLPNNQRVDTLLWKEVKAQLENIRQDNPNSVLTTGKLRYLLLRRALLFEEAAAIELVNQLGRIIAHTYAWIIGLMRPEEIVLTGSISELGQILLDVIEQELQKIGSVSAHTSPRLSMTKTSYLSMQGAIIFALQQELGIL